jgi:hypothetical protein
MSSISTARPDFFIIPDVVFSDDNLKHSDLFVFAAIYWFTKMKQEKCFANNEELARIANLKNKNSVSNSLLVLEKNGYISRVVKHGDRTEIKCLVSFGKRSSFDERHSSNDERHSSNDESLTTNKRIKNKNNDIASPIGDASKNLAPAEDEKLANQLISVFYDGGNKTVSFVGKERKAALEMIAKHGADKALRLAAFAVKVQAEQYAPTVTKPSKLLEKAADLLIYWERERRKSEQSQISVIE